MKRILIFSTAYYPSVGGAEVAIKELTDRLRGFEFDLITAKLNKTLPSKELIGRVNVYRIGAGRGNLDKFLLPFRGALLALKLNKERKYFCFWPVMVTYASGAAYIANILRSIFGKKKIPVVLTLQEGDSETHLRYRWIGLIHLSWKLALRRTNFLTGISNFLLHRAKKLGYRGKKALIPNGVNIKTFSRKITKKTQEEFKIKLGKRDGEVFLVTVGRLEHKNATDDIISSLVYLPEYVKLLIIGSGALKMQLQKQALKLKVEERVKFLGFIPHENIPEYFSASDIFVRPSRSEGFGNSFIEAMAAGLPVIATPVGGIIDFVDDKETGLFASPDNPQSIARAVRTLMDDTRLKAHVIDKAKNRVKDRYSWDYISKEIKRLVFLNL